MKSIYKKSILFVFLFSLLQVYVHAQNKDTLFDNQQLNEVIVTAEKQTANVQDIPASISYLGQHQMVNQRIWNTEDLKGLFPNLYLSQPGDGRNIIGMRGIATSSYEPAVAVYVDGVLQYDLDTYFDNLQNVKRIEVLRGPQGTLYGRNAMGGVINIITKKPANKLSGNLGVDIGNYGLQRYKLGFNMPIISGKLFFGLSGMYKKDNGFYKNKYNNSHYDKKHALLGNYYLKYLANSNWEITLNFKHSNVRDHGAFALSNSIKEAKAHPYKVNQDAITKMVDNVNNASLHIQHKGSWIDFSSQTAYQSNYRIYENPIDGDFSSKDIVSIVNNYGKDWNKIKAWTQAFKVNSSKRKGQIVTWTAGVFGFITDDPVKQGTHFGDQGALYGGMPHTTLLTTNKGTDKGVAIFGQTNIALTRRFGLTLGLRYDWESKQLAGKSQLLKEGSSTPLFESPDSSVQGKYHALSPKAVVSYKLSPHKLVYLSYTRGFRAGGISEVSGDPSEPPFKTFKPEFSNNYELGIKNEFFDRQLRWNLSLFYIRANNIQVPQLIMPQAFTLTKNAGKLESMGVESELTALLKNHFTLRWNVGLTKAKFTELSLPDPDPDNKQNIDYSGNQPLYTPEYTSNLMLQYHKKMGKKKSYIFHANVEWLWLGTTYYDMRNTLKQNPYSLINARAGIEKGAVSVNLWAKNIFNTLYVDYAYNFGAAHLGNPATFGVSVDFRWR